MMEHPASSATGEVGQLATTMGDYLKRFEDYGIVSRRDLTKPSLDNMDVMSRGRPYEVRLYVRLSGYEVCAKLRADYPPDLPIIMISAKNSSDDVIKGLKYKCNDYVTKPFEKSELLARINTQVKLRQMVNRQ
ncbi:hypothetical protein FOZ62_000027, partial [Perkinsus olseni]